jgi:hypothetical protein
VRTWRRTEFRMIGFQVRRVTDSVVPRSNLAASWILFLVEERRALPAGVESPALRTSLQRSGAR